MPLPGTLDVETWKGATWHVLYTWFDDDNQTDPHDLTGHDVELNFWRRGIKVLTLTEGAGLTLGGAAGTILVTLQTTDLDWTTSLRYELLATDPAGLVTPLAAGKFKLERP